MQDLELIDLALEEAVAAGTIAGASVVVWDAGALVYGTGVGLRDLDARLPAERDTLYRIASMSKAITHTAALISVERGLFQLDDPIARWAPELEQMSVLRTPSSSLDDVVPAARPITFRDLLGHRSGLTYGAFHGSALGRRYRDKLGADIDSHLAPDAWIAGVAEIPLLSQPGAAFHYGHSTDLLGLLLERIHQASLQEVLDALVLSPLKMTDTHFVVPEAKRSRCAALHGFDAAGALVRRDTAAGDATLKERPSSFTFVSGGQGLWSTADDFCTFARLFAGEGTADGVTLLTPTTLALLTQNQLSAEEREGARLMGRDAFTAGQGYSLGLAVVTEPEQADPLMCGGSVGSVGWPGAFGGWWRADPVKRRVVVFLTHNNVEPEQMAQGIGLGGYDVISEVQSLAG